MLHLDPRTGSKLLLPTLQAMGLPVVLADPQLPFADAAFVGCGPSGEVSIGVERKTVSEILEAQVDPHKRFLGGQLPGLVSHYDYRWLFVEGEWTTDRHGWLETYPASQHPRLARQIHGLLTSLEVRCGLRWRHTRNPRETALMLGNLYRWWQTPWDQHGSYKAVGDLDADVDTAFFRGKVKPVEQHARLLPGVRGILAKRIAARFLTVAAMTGATNADWRSIKGIGAEKAAAITKHLCG